MTPDWIKTAKSLGYENETAMWEALYLKDRASLSQLAIAFRTSTNSIRGRLQTCDIRMRNAGGANNQKFRMTEELAKRCEDEGTTSVARNIGLSYTSLHKALKRFRAPVSAVQGIAVSHPHNSPSTERPAPESSSESPPQEPAGPGSPQTATGEKLES